MGRVFLAALWLACTLAAQQASSDKKLQTPPPKPEEQEPPEEDESLKPKEYTLNPIEAQRNIAAGDYYYKFKKNYHAAANRYIEATRWNPTSAEAFFKLAECDEKMKDFAAAREAYTQYLGLSPDAKNAAEIKKKIAKWPEPGK